MKKLLLSTVIALAIYPATSSAQLSQIAESEVFNEPENGFGRLIQLKNGTTAFLHIPEKGDWEFTTYNAGHTKVLSKTIAPANEDIKHADVKKAYVIKDALVVFLMKLEKKKPTLYRVIIDIASGKITEETALGELDKVGFGDGYAIAFGGVPSPNFYISKDPASDHYAVVFFNTFVEDRSKRIEVLHYDDDNKLINRQFYQSPDDKYKFMNYLDMVVDGGREVSVVAAAYNTAKSGGTQLGSLIVASFRPGRPSTPMVSFNFPKAQDIESAMTRKNPVTGKLLIYCLKKMEQKANVISYGLYRVDIDPQEGTGASAGVNTASIDRIAKTKFRKKEKFFATPQDFYFTEDGGHYLVFEEVELFTSTSMPGAGGMSRNRTEYYIGDIGLVYYDQNGAEKAVSYLPKRDRLWYAGVASNYHKALAEGGTHFKHGNQYKYFGFVHTDSKDYLLINDIEENQKRIDEKKDITTIQGLGDCEAFGFDMSANESIPRRVQVFKEKNSMLLPSMTSYDAGTQTIVSLKCFEEKRSKKARLVWLKAG